MASDRAFRNPDRPGNARHFPFQMLPASCNSDQAFVALECHGSIAQLEGKFFYRPGKFDDFRPLRPWIHDVTSQ
jgi:hypothetical protein